MGLRDKNIGIKISFKDKSANITCNIVEAPGSPFRWAQHCWLFKLTVLEGLNECFDLLGCFPGEKYHIQLIDDHIPVIHTTCSVSVHILLLYKEELDKIITDDVITTVSEPANWVNLIACNSKETHTTKRRPESTLIPRTTTRTYVGSITKPAPSMSSHHS